MSKPPAGQVGRYPLALVADIASVLRGVAHSADEFREAAYLAESPAFKRIVDRGLKQVKEGKARRAEELLSELWRCRLIYGAWTLGRAMAKEQAGRLALEMALA